MGLLYGDGKPLATPPFVHGWETPDQKLRRLREINEALDKQQRREEEQEARDLFREFESANPPRPSPPSPPRLSDAPVFPVDPLPGEQLADRLGTQNHFDLLLDGFLEDYEETFGMTPLFGSQAYESAERRAEERWRSDQVGVPDDIVANRSVGLFLRSRELRDKPERFLPPDVRLLVGGEDARFDEEAGAVRISEALLEAPGGPGTVAHEGAHARHKALPDEKEVLSLLNKAFDNLSSSEKSKFFRTAQAVLGQAGQGTLQNRYEVGGPEEIFADVVAISSIRGRDAVPQSLLELVSPPVDSKFDITVDAMTADIAETFVRGGVPLEGGGKMGVQEKQALRFAREVMDALLVDLEAAAREDIGDKADDQAVREWMYEALRVNEHLSDVLDEWGFPRGEDIGVPPGAEDEALRRYEVEAGEFFKGFPGRPGILSQIGSLFSKKFIPTVATPAILAGAVKGQAFLSLDDVHRVGQESVADPLARTALFTAAQPVRAGELGFTELTGIETDTVSGALRSQLAEDIFSEVISPEFLAIALPFASVGVRGLTGAAKLTRIVANLTVGTDVGLARGFPLLRPDKARAVLRGLTAVARSPLALRGLPQAVRDNPVFRLGLDNLREVRAGMVGRFANTPEEYLRAIGATDDAKFGRVVDDLANGRPSKVDDLPLRQAVERDLMSRSMEDIIETGVSVPKPTGDLGGRVSGELANFWRGEEGGVNLGRFLSQREALTEQRLFERLAQGKGVSHKDLTRVVRNAELIDPDLLGVASSDELFGLLQGQRLEMALGGASFGRMKKAQLVELIDQAALNISRDAPRNRMLSELKAVRESLKGVKGRIETRSFEFLSEGDVARMAQLAADGELVPGALPTQLIKGKKAAKLRNLQADMFDTSKPLSTRQGLIDKYVSEMEKIAAGAEEGSVTRISATIDAKTNRWVWETQFGVKPWATAQKDLRENLRVLTSLHLGTPEERLAGLAADRSRVIREAVTDFTFSFRGRIGKTELARFEQRLLTMMLDAEDGIEIVDAGRQLEGMFQIAKVPQGIKNEAFDALKVLTTHGATPSAKEITAMRRVLEPVLGRGTTSQLLNARNLTTKGGELVLNTIGLPRALMASSDISAVLRQGAMLGARQPVDWVKMVGRSIRAFWQPEYADALRDSITHRGVIRLQSGETVDLYDFTKRLGSFYGSDAGQQGLTFSEEVWMTRFASKWGWHLPRDAAGRFSLNPTQWEKVPFPVPLAQSERSYVLGLDKMRADYIDNMVGKLIRRGMANGREATITDFEQLALFVNNASGRGNLPEFLRNYHPFINALLFAPRLIVSRFAILGDVARHTIRGGPMRRVVWETLAADAATAAAGLTMLDLGLSEVGVDANVNFLNPLEKGKDGVWRTNSDFLKLRVEGTTFIDFGASFLPVQRLILGLGVAALQGDGEMAAQLGGRFLRSKEAPVPSGVHDVVTGTDFIGGKVELSLDDLLGDVIASRSIPLSWQGPVEAIAASREEIDIDIGPAIMDLVSNWKLDKDEAIVAGAALSSELIGGGSVSFFRPGEKLRELDDERLQDMLSRGEITPTENQEINDMDDLNRFQAKQVEDERGSREKDLEKKQEEEGLWRDSEWAKNKKAEREFHESLRIDGHYTNPDTGKREKLWDWTPEMLGDMLRTGQIDGADYRFRTAANVKAEINVQRALFGFEGEDIEDIENPVDKLIAEYWEIEPQITPGGEYDFDTFQEERKAKQAEVAKAVGDPEGVAEYFASFRMEDETQLALREAKEDRELFDATPAYMGDISAGAIDKLLDRTKNYLLSVDSRWGLAKYIQWLYYQDPVYQTNEWAVAYWVARGERDVVANPDRTSMVFGGPVSDGTFLPENPELVMFYPSIFQDLTDQDKQRFINKYRGGFLSKELEERLIEEGFSFQSGTELFQSQPLSQ